MLCCNLITLSHFRKRLVALFVLSGALLAHSADPDQIAFFENEIRPIFAEVCNECHGSDKQESNLRLDTKAAFDRGGDSGPLLNPEILSASRLIDVIEYEGEIKMPEDMKLADEDIEAIRAWVLMGAPWPEEDLPGIGVVPTDSFAEFIEKSKETHWAFQPIRMPQAPPIQQTAWVANEVDSFILARLEEAGLAPSPEADRRTLIRRLHFDLTGLPPSFEDVQDFVGDDRPEAYEELVDRLLASPHYGERWGRHWLDVARYADTKGYVFEEDRFFPYSYTYRDYVIRSFNEDLPYDQFIVEQLAADRLELGEDKRPLAAMGFLTLGRRFINNIDDITDDRIDVISRGLMGLTVGCARCHDHKFDPIDSSDYYAMYGVLRSTKKPGELPLISEPDPDDPHYQEYLELLAEKEADLEDYRREVHIEMLTETRDKLKAYLVAAHDAKDISDDTDFKTLAKEAEVRHQILRPWVDFLKKKLEAPDAIFKPYAWFDAIPAESFEQEAIGVVERIGVAKEGDEKVNRYLRDAFKGDAPASMSVVMERYAEVLTDIDKMWRDRLSAYVQMVVYSPDAPPAVPTKLDNDDAEALRQIIYGAGVPSNIKAGRVYGISDTPKQQKVRAKQRSIARHEATHLGRPDRASALYDSDTPFDPYVFLRGKSANKGDTVPRRFLQVLSKGKPEPFTNGGGRLELARAIASKDNPLTARVFVNRVWTHHFGRGLVDTSSDFGVRSPLPTHPGLLDYLAADFIEHDWSVKNLHKRILLSSAYRQSSHTHARGDEIDIENRLVWRQSRKRLEFEPIRDSILSASGEIDLEIGGPPVSLTKEPFTNRRTVYGLVERQNMEAFIKSFDFASPDTHSPKRFTTIVPQQALFLMNSPFVIEHARNLEIRSNCCSDDSIEARGTRLFEICFQRAPTKEEIEQMAAFLSRTDFDDGPAPPDPSGWEYGYGSYDDESRTVVSFTAFEHFKDKRWLPNEDFPDDEFGHISVVRGGGHPGNDNTRAAIHRWVALRAGTVSLTARFKHPSDKGNGLIGYIVSSRIGLIHEHSVFNDEDDAKHEGIPVEEGDTIDFVASPNASPTNDTYSWKMTVTMDRPEHSEGQSLQTKWDAQKDFRGPLPEPPEPLSPWGQLAQALLLTNEFMYVD